MPYALHVSGVADRCSSIRGMSMTSATSRGPRSLTVALGAVPVEEGGVSLGTRRFGRSGGDAGLLSYLVPTEIGIMGKSDSRMRGDVEQIHS